MSLEIELQEMSKKQKPRKEKITDFINFKKVKVGDILIFTENDGKRYFRKVEKNDKRDKKRSVTLSKKQYIMNFKKLKKSKSKKSKKAI